MMYIFEPLRTCTTMYQLMLAIHELLWPLMAPNLLIYWYNLVQTVSKVLRFVWMVVMNFFILMSALQLYVNSLQFYFS